MTRAYQSLFDELRAYKHSRALAVAFSTGLVDAIGDRATTSDVAARCSMREDWTCSLLSVLADAEVVEKIEDTWRLTNKGKDAVANEALRAFAGYHFHCYEAWLDLSGRCSGRINGPGFHRRASRNAEFVRSYLSSMEAIARRNLPFLKERFHPNGTVIDVGAGPSTFCRHLVAEQRCRVTALDLPPITKEAQRLFGCPASFEWVAADFREYVPKQKYDALFCSHLLEYASKLELPAWLLRMAGFIRSGGIGAFLTFLRAPDSEQIAQLDLFELSTGVNGDILGHVCTRDELQEALRIAGASRITCKPLPKGASYPEYLVTCTWA